MPFLFSHVEYCDIHFVYGFCDGNARAAVEEYQRRFPDRRIPSRRVKAVPLQAWSGPEGSRKLRFPDFMTTAQDGGKFVSLTHRPPLPPGNTPGTHFC